MTPSAGSPSRPAEVEAPDGAAEALSSSAARRAASVRRLRHIARCPRCGAWTYRGACATPHEVAA